MTINQIEIKTFYHIEVSFKDFIGALEDQNARLGYPRAFAGIDSDATKESLYEAFKADTWDKRWSCWHGDTYQAIAQHLGFRGCAWCGLYDEKKDARILTAYNMGADDLCERLK